MLDNFIDLGNSAWREIALAAIAFWVAIYVVNTISKERRISALGGHGSVCKSWIPFGILRQRIVLVHETDVSQD